MKTFHEEQIEQQKKDDLEMARRIDQEILGKMAKLNESQLRFIAAGKMSGPGWGCYLEKRYTLLAKKELAMRAGKEGST